MAARQRAMGHLRRTTRQTAADSAQPGATVARLAANAAAPQARMQPFGLQDNA
jgi:hypothetical protein